MFSIISVCNNLYTQLAMPPVSMFFYLKIHQSYNYRINVTFHTLYSHAQLHINIFYVVHNKQWNMLFIATTIWVTSQETCKEINFFCSSLNIFPHQVVGRVFESSSKFCYMRSELFQIPKLLFSGKWSCLKGFISSDWLGVPGTDETILINLHWYGIDIPFTLCLVTLCVFVMCVFVFRLLSRLEVMVRGWTSVEKSPSPLQNLSQFRYLLYIHLFLFCFTELQSCLLYHHSFIFKNNVPMHWLTDCLIYIIVRWMVNRVDLLLLSSASALETRPTWFRKLNDGPQYHTSMSKLYLIYVCSLTYTHL